MKILKGKVVSDKMTKTAVVEVTSLWQHPIYKKRVKRSKRFLADNTIGAKTGDNVLMQESRPLSKLKRFVINKINK